MQLGTFSIVARDKRAGEFGVASATAAPCVGAMLPYAIEGVGAVATQAWVNVNLGHQGLEIMRRGIPVKAAIEAVLSDDDGRARRQVIGIDSNDVFGYTGGECSDGKGHVLGKDFAVAGNILSSMSVLDEMASAFKGSRGDLANRLLSVLEAGERTGGDSRGKMSAVMLVASPKPRLYHDLRVDLAVDPVKDLRRLHEECVRLQEEYGDDAGEVLRKQVVRVQR